MTVDAGRSIVLTLDYCPDLDELVAEWLARTQRIAVFSSAVLASPIRDGGVVEQVLAIDGLAANEIDLMLDDLALTPIVEPFRSRR